MQIKLQSIALVLAIAGLIRQGAAVQIVAAPQTQDPESQAMASTSQTADSNTSRYKEYFEYMHKFEKKYDTTEEMGKHFKIYCRNIAKIEAHNALNSSYKQGVNKFTDIDDDEFQTRYVMTTSPNRFFKPVTQSRPAAS
jgi:hypothetical protein